MKIVYVLFLLIIGCSAAAAQDRSEPMSTVGRDATVAEIAEEFAELNLRFQQEWQMAVTEDAAQMVVDAAIKRVLALKDRLADNPYVRIASFSIGLPAGISVEFSFPD